MQLKRLGPYEIGRSLGKGGMGSVYEAIDSTSGQRVAVKALSPHLATAEGFRERFEAEIDSLKTLRHDGIVRLFGYGEQEGVLFYSMEVVDGISLEDEMRAGRRFTWREVTNIAIQLCLALKHAHDHGIIHRDIKPANILLYDDDKVKLADFGIARLFGTTQLTTAGGVLGTADYMSPEQADGRPVTARCDQYSLGGVMYALLAGRPPFRAKNLPQMLQLQRFAQPEPVRRYAPDTPEQLEQVIGQLLAKEPSERYPNTQVLARHLRAMYMALSRPAPDDFALANDQGRTDPTHPDWEHSLLSAPTQPEIDDGAAIKADSKLRAGTAGRKIGAARPQDALTLAADEVMTAGNVERGSATKAPAMATLTEPKITNETANVARFTTVEEDEARRLAEQQRSWLVTALQLGALATLLSGMGWLVIHLSRPPTADQLYHEITSEADLKSEESLAIVGEEVDEFLRRYPSDPRVAEVEQYAERITLDKLERRLLQRRGRSGSGVSEPLLPIESLYLEAIRLEEVSSEEALRVLESLVNLYELSPSAGNGRGIATLIDAPAQRQAEERQADVVRLAKRRIARLRAENAKQIELQTAMLQERLEAAADIATQKPTQAAAVYQAIVDLYERNDWAGEIVATARQRLAEIETRN